MKWDADSPVSFHPDGHTVHDFDKRFALEDEGIVLPTDRFKWEWIEKPPNRQLGMFDAGEIFKE